MMTLIFEQFVICTLQSLYLQVRQYNGLVNFSPSNAYGVPFLPMMLLILCIVFASLGIGGVLSCTNEDQVCEGVAEFQRIHT
jgi:hypothetical protein